MYGIALASLSNRTSSRSIGNSGSVESDHQAKDSADIRTTAAGAHAVGHAPVLKRRAACLAQPPVEQPSFLD
jgi:hypothetical protein